MRISPTLRSGLRCGAAIAASALPCAAQADHWLTLPTAFEAAEGDGAEAGLFAAPYLRWQQIDGSSVGRDHAGAFFLMRRDATAGAQAASSTGTRAESPNA